jgi:hypothetical protein
MGEGAGRESCLAERLCIVRESSVARVPPFLQFCPCGTPPSSRPSPPEEGEKERAAASGNFSAPSLHPDFFIRSRRAARRHLFSPFCAWGSSEVQFLERSWPMRLSGCSFLTCYPALCPALPSANFRSPVRDVTACRQRRQASRFLRHALRPSPVRCRVPCRPASASAVPACSLPASCPQRERPFQDRRRLPRSQPSPARTVPQRHRRSAPYRPWAPSRSAPSPVPPT